MPNSDYGIPLDVLQRAQVDADMMNRYPEGYARMLEDRKRENTSASRPRTNTER